ncbi:uncharacterized protein CCR75_003263 [Bremia lactucae]|uniref:Uncharacterized protein n=1 Tax=Bremia lactucae TaxID=4779 RepID=A0A976NY53_BRELC|nr:hypothetical protein CCR75_003263 [Bremia lactucae]
MTTFTSELLREMIITAESKSEDWEGNIFGYKERRGPKACMVAVNKAGYHTNLRTRSQQPRQGVVVVIIVVGIILNVIARILMGRRTQEQIMRVQEGHNWSNEPQKIGLMKVKKFKSVKSLLEMLSNLSIKTIKIVDGTLIRGPMHISQRAASTPRRCKAWKIARGTHLSRNLLTASIPKRKG